MSEIKTLVAIYSANVFGMVAVTGWAVCMSIFMPSFGWLFAIAILAVAGYVIHDW